MSASKQLLFSFMCVSVNGFYHVIIYLYLLTIFVFVYLIFVIFFPLIVISISGNIGPYGRFSASYMYTIGTALNQR